MKGNEPNWNREPEPIPQDPLEPQCRFRNREPRACRTEPPTRSRGLHRSLMDHDFSLHGPLGFAAPIRGLYRVPFSRVHCAFWFTLSAVSGPRTALPCSSGPLPQSRTRGSTFFANFRPQTPEFCTPPRGGPHPFRKLQAPNSRLVYSPAWPRGHSPKAPKCAVLNAFGTRGLEPPGTAD